jgi:hypothetical protein
MSKIEVDAIEPQSGTSLTVGASGDTVTVPSGVTFDASNSTLTLPDGSVSLAKLSATGTKDATTFLRGDNTFAEAGGGKVLQVVSTAKTDTTTTTSTSYTDITGMSVAITPTSASSKILVQVSLNVEPSNGYISSIKLLRDSTGIIGDSDGSRDRGTFWIKGHYASTMYNQALLYLDTPNSTSELTYKLQWLIESGGTFALNRTVSDEDSSGRPRNLSTITVIEVSA